MKKSLISLAIFALSASALAQSEAGDIRAVESAWAFTSYPASFSGLDAELEGAAAGLFSSTRPMPQLNSTGRTVLSSLAGTLPGVGPDFNGVTAPRVEVQPYRLTHTSFLVDNYNYLDKPLDAVLDRSVTGGFGNLFR